MYANKQTIIAHTGRSIMLQYIADQLVYVVDIPEPSTLQLPIVGYGFEAPYAQALTLALMRKLISTPGKYGITVDFSNNSYQVWSVAENSHPTTGKEGIRSPTTRR
jgi:hypothetical protein